eukprot:jgi/Mesvir1/17916/Mv12979-RA.1
MGQHDYQTLSAEEWSDLIGTYDISHVHRRSWEDKLGIAGILEALLSSLRTYADPVPMYDDALFVQLLSFLEQHSLLLLSHAGTAAFATAIATLELLAGKPPDAASPSSGSPLQPLRRGKTAPRESHQLLTRSIAMTATTSILIELDAAVNAPATLQRFGGWLLDIVVLVNNSADRMLRATACQCLRELECDAPGLLRKVTAQLYAACERERTQAFQSYTLLLVDALLGIVPQEQDHLSCATTCPAAQYHVHDSSGAGALDTGTRGEGVDEAPPPHVGEDAPSPPLLFSSPPTNGRVMVHPARTPPRPPHAMGAAPPAPTPNPHAEPRPFLLPGAQTMAAGDRDASAQAGGSPWKVAGQGGSAAGACAEDARTLRKCVNLLLEAAPKMNIWCRADLLLALATLLRRCARSPARAPYLLELPARGSLRHLLGLDATFDPLLTHTLARIQGGEAEDAARAVAGAATGVPPPVPDKGGGGGGVASSGGVGGGEEEQGLASVTRQVRQHIAALAADSAQECAHRLLALHWLMAAGCEHKGAGAGISTVQAVLADRGILGSADTLNKDKNNNNASGWLHPLAATIPAHALQPSVFDPLAVVALKLEACVAQCGAVAANSCHLQDSVAVMAPGVGGSQKPLHSQLTPGKVTSATSLLSVGLASTAGGGGGGGGGDVLLQRYLSFLEECSAQAVSVVDPPAATLVGQATAGRGDALPSVPYRREPQEPAHVTGRSRAASSAPPALSFFDRITDSRHIRAMRKRHAAAAYGSSSSALPAAPPTASAAPPSRVLPTSLWSGLPPGGGSWALWRTMLLALATATATPDLCPGGDGEEESARGDHPVVLATVLAAATCAARHPSQVPHFLRLVAALRLVEEARTTSCSRHGMRPEGIRISTALLVHVMVIVRSHVANDKGDNQLRAIIPVSLGPSATETAAQALWTGGSITTAACRPALLAAADAQVLALTAASRAIGGQGSTASSLTGTRPDPARLRGRLAGFPSLSSPCRALPFLLALLGRHLRGQSFACCGQNNHSCAVPLSPSLLCLDYLHDWLLAVFCPHDSAAHNTAGFASGASQAPPDVGTDDSGGGKHGSTPPVLTPAGLWQEGSCLLLLVRHVLANSDESPGREGVVWHARRLLRLCERVFPNLDLRDAARRQRYLLEQLPTASTRQLAGSDPLVTHARGTRDGYPSIMAAGGAGDGNHRPLMHRPVHGIPEVTPGKQASTCHGRDSATAGSYAPSSPLVSVVAAPPALLASHFQLERLASPRMRFSLDDARDAARDAGEGDMRLLGADDSMSEDRESSGAAMGPDGPSVASGIPRRACLSNWRCAMRGMETAWGDGEPQAHGALAVLQGHQARLVERYCAWLDSGGAATIAIPCRLAFLPQDEAAGGAHSPYSGAGHTGGSDDPWLVVEGVDSSPRPEAPDMADASGHSGLQSLVGPVVYGVVLSFVCRPRHYCRTPPPIVVPVLRRASTGPVSPRVGIHQNINSPGMATTAALPSHAEVAARAASKAGISCLPPGVPALVGAGPGNSHHHRECEGGAADATPTTSQAAASPPAAPDRAAGSVSALLRVRPRVPLPCTLQACLSFSDQHGDSWHGQVAHIPVYMEDLFLPLEMPEDILAYEARSPCLPPGSSPMGALEQGMAGAEETGEVSVNKASILFDGLWHAFAALPHVAITSKMLPNVTCDQVAAVAGDSRGLGRFVLAVRGQLLLEAFFNRGFEQAGLQSLAAPRWELASNAACNVHLQHRNITVEEDVNGGASAAEAVQRSGMPTGDYQGMLRMAILLPPNWHLLVCVDVGACFSMAHIRTDFLPALAFVDELLEAFVP